MSNQAIVKVQKGAGKIPERSTLNTTVAVEHLPDIERQIRFIKERARAICITLTFNRVPGQIVIDMVLFVVLYMNAFPPVLRN